MVGEGGREREGEGGEEGKEEGGGGRKRHHKWQEHVSTRCCDRSTMFPIIFRPQLVD